MALRTKIFSGFALFAVVITIYNSFLPLHPDEAYYWLWSRSLDWSYYDHPGMVAWLIRIFSVFGDSVAAIRLTTVFCMVVSGYSLTMLSYRICLDYFGSAKAVQAAYMTFAAFNVLPATVMGYVFITPDSPLIMFWCISMYTGYMSVKSGKLIWFIFTGIFIALMITSKYTAVLFPMSLLFYITLFNKRLFFNKYTWLACFIGILGIVPIVLWNVQHDWISIKFQYEHGTSNNFSVLWDEFFILLGGLQLLPTPIFAFIIYKASFYEKKFRKDMWWQYLFSIFALPIGFFLFKGLFKKMELNWPIIGFLSALPMMCIYIVATESLIKLFKIGFFIAALITFVLVSSPFLPYPDNMNIAYRIHGTREALAEVEKFRSGSDDEAYFSNHLTNASMMTYYLQGHPKVYIPVESRFSQFDIWDKDIDYSKLRGIYFGHNKSRELAEIFGKTELLEEYPTGSGKRIRNYYILEVGE